jgi:hypothetical protein
MLASFTIAPDNLYGTSSRALLCTISNVEPAHNTSKNFAPTYDEVVTSGKKPIGGALFWHMRGAYGMRHQCHTTNNSLLVAHLNMRHAYVEY